MTVCKVDIDPDLPNRIAVWSDYRLKDAVKSVPGARWNADLRRWHVPLTWPACLALRAEVGEFLEIGADLRAWASDQREVKDELIRLRTMVAPDTLDDLAGDDDELLPGFAELFPHQLVDAQCIALAGSYLITNETGTGKSRGALAGLSLLNEDAGSSPIFPLMIVCPKSMIQTWTREVDGFFPGIDVSECRGTPSKVKKALEPGHDIYVIAYDTLWRYSRLAPFPTVKLSDDEKRDKEVQLLDLGSIILDECHRIKNPKSKRTRACWQICENATFKVGLTGTPIQDQPEDMWAVLRALFHDEYPTKTSYVERYLEVDYNRWGGREITGVHPTRKGEFFANLDAVMRRITKDAAGLKLPPKLFEMRWVDLPAKMRKAYDDMRKSLAAELEGGSLLTAKSSLEAAGRLIQLANASGEVDPDGKFHMELPSPKIEAFLDDVAEGDFDGEQIVVYSDSRQLIELLSKAMIDKGLLHGLITGDVTGDDRQEVMDSFQAGFLPFCLITRAGGEGITLTAASTMVRLIRSWSYTAHAQAEDRVHRIGSERHSSIRIIDYVTTDTVEEGQIVRLSAKESRAQEVLRDSELLALLK
jgi:SNF2 family DNA or RNA helicase